MRIIILGTAYPYRGGLATFNERLARQFQSEGHEVEIYTFNLQYPGFLLPRTSQYSTEKAPENLRIVRKVNSCNPFNWSHIGNEIRRKCPDILISCYWMAFFAPCFSRIEHIVHRNHHTKCLALVHNMFSLEQTLLDKWYAPRFIRNTDGFVALSESVVADIDKLDKHNKPKTFSPHPIYDHYGERLSKNVACAAKELDSRKDYMLFFGLIRAYKGLDLLLNAFAQIKDILPNLQLIIAGEFYENEDKYRILIANNGLTNRVIIHDEFIPDSDLKYYFSAASLIVQPYKSATQSGVTQVAFHFEKPMLVTNVGGLAEIVIDHKMGYAVAPNSTAIAEAILDYYQNSRQESFTEYLKKEKTKYTWSNMTAAFYKIMQ